MSFKQKQAKFEKAKQKDRELMFTVLDIIRTQHPGIQVEDVQYAIGNPPTIVTKDGTRYALGEFPKGVAKMERTR